MSRIAADVPVAQQADCEALEAKNNELSSHFLEKAKALARQKKMYDSLKGQVMAANAAVAAGDEAKMTLQTVRAINRFADRMPGARTSTGMYSPPGGTVQQPGGNRLHNKQGSGSSGSSGQQRGGIGLGPAPSYSQHLQGRGMGGRVNTGRTFILVLLSISHGVRTDNIAESAPVGTPRPSRLPVVGGSRQPLMSNVNVGPSYQTSSLLQRQNVGNNSLNRGFFNSLLGVPKPSRRAGGPLQR